VALFASDATREEPREEVLAAVAPELASARAVQLVIATGSHDPRSVRTRALGSSLNAALRAAGLPVAGEIVHDPFKGPFADLGRTSRGTPILLNRGALDADLFLVLSDMKPHYFAGYSCPPKFVFPGVAALEAIEANHSLVLDPASVTGHHPWHPDPGRRGNLLAADYCEAFEIAVGGRPSFALAYGSSVGRILWAEAGPLREACTRGISHVDRLCGVETGASFHAVISPGGHPNDIDLYVGQRALELTSAAVRDRGEVLFLCECPEGLGPAHSLAAFWHPLKGDLEKVAVQPPRPYRLYSHKAVRFARMILRLRALHLHSSLAAEEVAAARLSPAPDPQAVVDGWLRTDPGARILLFDGASKLSVSAR
jgi:nickel-dependent lactate racemase